MRHKETAALKNQNRRCDIQYRYGKVLPSDGFFLFCRRADGMIISFSF
ncbi:hypothetical protein HMPREF1548_06345 [Clostridium sp. KLE 1755]|nr:hypothetical protein HMPREF1548_06345 [Clostridium sp. KLE 1755]